jgi:hypothetical protein
MVEPLARAATALAWTGYFWYTRILTKPSDGPNMLRWTIFLAC